MRDNGITSNGAQNKVENTSNMRSNIEFDGRQLAKEGFNIALVSRTQSKLESVE